MAVARGSHSEDICITEGTETKEPSEERWYVLRDLLRCNSTHPAYLVLPEKGLTVYTPMKSRIVRGKNGVTRKESVPYVHGLLFAYGQKEKLDSVILKIKKLQYRYIKGRFQEPMWVSDTEMQRFIRFVESTDSPKFLMPHEISPSMYGSRVLIKGGTLDGLECQLLKAQGCRTKKILVEIPGLIAVSVEIKDFEYLVPLVTPKK